MTDESWVPVTTKLPEKKRKVLTMDTDRNVRIAIYRGKTLRGKHVWQYSDINPQHGIVTYWSPLPQQPAP